MPLGRRGWAALLSKESPASGSSPILGLGLAGETGEVVEHLKKLLRDGTWDPDRIADELGDVAYYWARLCIAVGRTPSELLERSVAKIEAKLRQRTDSH